MRIAIIDGQGAGIGKSIIKKLRKEFEVKIYIVALGTNTMATSNMVRAGANVGVTGEKAICSFCKSQQLDAIIGPIGIFCSGALNGEITDEISKSIFNLECTKFIIPLQKHGIYIPGTRDLQIRDILDEIITELKELAVSK